MERKMIGREAAQCRLENGNLAFVKKLLNVGSSKAVVIPHSWLAFRDITTVTIELNGDGNLTIRPYKDEKILPTSSQFIKQMKKQKEAA
jgi:antitoxin component of MazEF toxin-antitoxin module